jgi:hypothetical protein
VSNDAAAHVDHEVRVTLRAGVEWRHKKPNVVVLFHVYGEKPRLKWITPLPRPKAPRCKCGKRCAYYGPIGGYSVACETCNRRNAKRQRDARARSK